MRQQMACVEAGLPQGWTHGDFCHKNALRSDSGQLRLLDWQYVSRESFPDRDLAHFPLLYTQYLMAHHSQDPSDWFRRQFLAQAGELTPILRRYFDAYSAAASLSDTFALLSIPLGIVRQANRIAEVHYPPLPEGAIAMWRAALRHFGQSPGQLLGGRLGP
jgi:hypothetical protein